MFNMFFMFVFLSPFWNSTENLKHMKMNRWRSIKQYSEEEEEVQLPGSLPVEVGVKCDIVGMRIRDGPSPPRVPSEY